MNFRIELSHRLAGDERSRSWRSVAAATAIVAATLLPIDGRAQQFSESEKKTFLNSEVPSVGDAVIRWFKERGWWINLGKIGPVNQNSPRMGDPRAMGWQYSYSVGTDDHSPTQSGKTVRLLYLKYSSPTEAAQEVARQVEAQKAQFARQQGVTNVRTERLDLSSNATLVVGDWQLPSGRMRNPFRVLFSVGSYAILMEESRGGQASLRKKHLGLAQAFKDVLAQRGVSAPGGGVTNPSPPAPRPDGGSIPPAPLPDGGPLPDDVVSGKRLGMVDRPSTRTDPLPPIQAEELPERVAPFLFGGGTLSSVTSIVAADGAGSRG